MRRATIIVALASAIALLLTPTALAQPAFERFDVKDGWICGADEGLVDNHCMNVRSRGTVRNIKVLAPDPRGPQESASFDAKVDDRPCPHDSGSDDGTWWEFAEGLYVCHHSGSQP